jgi:hypothetical protein
MREVAIEPSEAHKNTSEGIFAVCSSIADATLPSLCFEFDAITFVFILKNGNNLNDKLKDISNVQKNNTQNEVDIINEKYHLVEYNL